MDSMTESQAPIKMSYPGAVNEDDCLEQQIQHLLVAVEHEIRSTPAGMNELSLIKALQGQPWELLGDVVFSEPEKLYPVHFLLYFTMAQGAGMLVTSIIGGWLQLLMGIATILGGLTGLWGLELVMKWFPNRMAPEESAD